MIVLDENVIRSQREILLAHRLPIRQIGIELGSKGMDDEDILPLLMRLQRATFLTRDDDFYRRDRCHPRYCLVVLNADETEVARFVRRVLSHPQLKTQAMRMGRVIQAGEAGLLLWTAKSTVESSLPWMRLRG